MARALNLGGGLGTCSYLRSEYKRAFGFPLCLAHQLMGVQQCLQPGEKGMPDVIHGLKFAD